jgi:hypothetical protein
VVDLGSSPPGPGSLLDTELLGVTTPFCRVFAKCHSLVPPGSFFNACVSDSCQDKSTKDLCQSLEAYAALCRARGVCTDWRNATSGLCGELGRSWGSSLQGPSDADTHLCAYRPPLPFHQGVQAMQLCAAGVL